MNYHFYDIKKHNWIAYHRNPEVDVEYQFWKYLLENFKKALRLNYKWVKRSIKKHFRGYDYLNNSPIPQTNGIIFIAPTLNNIRSLRPVWTQCEPSEYTIIDGSNHYLYYPENKVTRYTFKYIFPLLRLYIFSNKKDKRLTRLNLDQIFPTMGLLKVTEEIIQNNNVRLIVMANDHSPLQRGFLSVADEYGIPTMYIQHATVTDKFPPLQFTYSFLDGEESVEKYAKIGGMTGRIYAIGSPRFDEVFHYRNSSISSNALGIAVSRVDNIEETMRVIKLLYEKGCHNIIFRPHPNILSDDAWNNFTLEISSSFDVKLSNPEEESPFEYLSRIHCLISGESGLHLDSLLMGVPSICYNFNRGRVFDLYGYVQDGMLRYERTLDGLWKSVYSIYNDEEGVNVSMARRYNAAFMTKYEGQISAWIASFIQNIIAGGSFTLDESMPLVPRNYGTDIYYTFEY